MTLLAGPIFSREVLTSPRQLRHYLVRSGYVAALFILMYTAGQATFGWQQVRNVGDVARFGHLVFTIFSLVQLSLVLFFALLFAAGNVSQEKDRQTLILLLMTDLRDRELVLGKLSASLLMVAVLLAASVPAFAFIHLLGGVSLDQIFWALAICGATSIAAGSWGCLVAFWREKTFQTLAISVLGSVVYLGVVWAMVAVAGNSSETAARWGAYLNPYLALLQVLDPLGRHAGSEAATVSALGFVVAMGLLAVLLNGVTIFRLRVWNPSRFIFFRTGDKQQSAESKLDKTRAIWKNPVVWREIRTKAYGRKVAVIKAVYAVLALCTVLFLVRTGGTDELILGMIAPAGFAFVGLSLMSLMLINAQAVTALTTERDGKTLELLLMTDVSAKEFIFGKLGGVLYNTKEVILIPLALVAYYAYLGQVSGENVVYLTAGFLVLVTFASMLGLHSGLTYETSRSAIASSLGTIFFLFIGIFIFMMLLVEARSSFFLQFQSFVVFILAGSIAIYATLARKNPSGALMISAAVLPFLTFYAITAYLLQGTLGVCLSIAAAYGFTTLAMLIPAVSEFDVALGRTTLDKG